MGLFDRLARHGGKLDRARRINRDGRVMMDRALDHGSRMHVLPRQALIEVLLDGAREAGVEIITSSMAIAADPAGELTMADGRRLRADLVVAADGARSKVRDLLRVGASYRPLPTKINRYLIPSRELTPEPATREHWSGHYRIGITSCGRDLTYVYQICPEWDKSATVLPNDVAFWSTAFPRLRREIEILSQTPSI